MSKTTAQKLIDRAAEFWLAQIAQEIAEIPSDQISGDHPTIKKLKEYLGKAASDGASVTEKQSTQQNQDR
ncbi:MAG: hypothetical protein ACAF41_11910 [Leptolyngbya sp. BL-A-14]